MPVHLNLHILVDPNGKANVFNQTISGGPVPTTQLQPGDKVTFTSNDVSSEIRFKNGGRLPPNAQSGSPFPDQLAAGKRHKVSIGTAFTVRTVCDFNNHFVFDCGHEVSGRFSEWGHLDGDTPGGNMPGPND
jgi:hypothetical protein